MRQGTRSGARSRSGAAASAKASCSSWRRDSVTRMAKAAEIAVAAEEPYALAGARIVRARTQELFEHDEGVLDTVDIERVHDMRVATRRLRAVLEVFAPCFPSQPFKAALRDVKALAHALGDRRDPDVHLEAMRAFGGVEPLLEHLRERQAAANV